MKLNTNDLISQVGIGYPLKYTDNANNLNAHIT